MEESIQEQVESVKKQGELQGIADELDGLLWRMSESIRGLRCGDPSVESKLQLLTEDCQYAMAYQREYKRLKPDKKEDPPSKNEGRDSP